MSFEPTSSSGVTTWYAQATLYRPMSLVFMVLAVISAYKLAAQGQ
jgi:hypothetical protein